MVGRNAADIDREVRRSHKQEALPDDAVIPDLDDAEEELADRLDGLALPRRHPAAIVHLLPSGFASDAADCATALRIVSGLSVKQIARAFYQSRKCGDGAAHHPRQGEGRQRRRAVRDSGRGRAFRTARRGGRDDLFDLQRRLFGQRLGASEIRKPLCEEAIRLARLLLRLFQSEPESMGLAALLLLQHARAAARFDASGELILLDDQDRTLWNQKLIAEGAALIDKAMRHHRSGPYQVQAAIAALHSRAEKPEDFPPPPSSCWGARSKSWGRRRWSRSTCGRGIQIARARKCLADDRAARRTAVELLSLFRRARRLPDAARPQRRGAWRSIRAIALANTSAETAHIRMHLDRLIRDSRSPGTTATKK